MNSQKVAAVNWTLRGHSNDVNVAIVFMEISSFYNRITGIDWLSGITRHQTSLTYCTFLSISTVAAWLKEC